MLHIDCGFIAPFFKCLPRPSIVTPSLLLIVYHRLYLRSSLSSGNVWCFMFCIVHRLHLLKSFWADRFLKENLDSVDYGRKTRSNASSIVVICSIILIMPNLVLFIFVLFIPFQFCRIYLFKRHCIPFSLHFICHPVVLCSTPTNRFLRIPSAVICLTGQFWIV